MHPYVHDHKISQKVALEYPNVATKAFKVVLLSQIVVKSTCICWPGWVSKRMIGSGLATGFNVARYSLKILIFPGYPNLKISW